MRSYLLVFALIAVTIPRHIYGNYTLDNTNPICYIYFVSQIITRGLRWKSKWV